jgi:SHS2 domain-containing protein
MAARPYRFVSHTADVEFIASGREMEQCFENALLAMFETMAYNKKLASSKAKLYEFSVKDRAKTSEDLLWYLLQDTLSIADSKGIFPFKVGYLKIMEKGGVHKVDARILARPKEPGASKLDVKGVSRYNLKVEHKKQGVFATVVLDV